MSLDRSIHKVYRKVLDRIDTVKYGPQKAKGPAWRMREAAEEVRVPVLLNIKGRMRGGRGKRGRKYGAWRV